MWICATAGKHPLKKNVHTANKNNIEQPECPVSLMSVNGKKIKVGKAILNFLYV